MNFVLDASLALTFIFKDEATPETDEVLNTFGEGAKAAIPALWRWEIGNVLLLAERRKRITRSEIQRHLTFLKKMPIELDERAFDETWDASLLLAEKHSLTCYEAAYLELALRRGWALGTLDGDLRSAARAEKIKLLPASTKK